MLQLKKAVCGAMEDAGIVDASSQEGIDFCVERCPHLSCVLYDEPRKIPVKTIIRTERVSKLMRVGLGAREIGLEMGITKRTVRRYIKAINSGD